MTTTIAQKAINWERTIAADLQDHLFQGKVITIYGPRQVGKTTLCRKILKKFANDWAYFNCEDPLIKLNLVDKSASEIADYLGLNHKIVVLDEAQSITNIGRIIKLVHDDYPQIQIIATGSSAFELANKINEPLTGRKFEYYLYPLSMSEIYRQPKQWQENLNSRLIFGSYPDVIKTTNPQERQLVLQNLAGSYLYKDILTHENIKSPDILDKILRALALQLGGEVSYNELSQLIGADKATISKYIQLLEQSYIIFRLQPLTRNRRDEIRKLRKIYFYDLGLRNCLINNFNDLPLRQDTGALWENFLVVERLKQQHYHHWFTNNYYWRTHRGQEIDWVEEYDGTLHPYEFKLTSDRFKTTTFATDYSESTPTTLINRNNFHQFLNRRD